MPIRSFSESVRKALRSYVYLYIDPRTGEPFYIGKGEGNRVFAHLRKRPLPSHEPDSKKDRLILAIRRAGDEPIVEILKYGLTPREALLVEATAIELLGLDSLTNALNGHGRAEGSRGNVADIATELMAMPLTIKQTHSVILINIARTFRYGMSPQALYDATRSAWKVAPSRKNPKYALAVFRGIVREVYEIAAWVQGGSTMRSTDFDGHHTEIPNRWEFVGKTATEDIRRRYVGRSTSDYMRDQAQNPVRYVNCE